MDGWFDEKGSNQPSCSSASPCVGLLDLHRGSFCGVETGCVPGLRGLDCSEVESRLMSSTSTVPRRQVYQISTQMGTSVFTDESLQQSPLQLSYADQNYPSSPSYSLRSFSAGSPECSSLIMSKPYCAPRPPEANLREATMEQMTHQRRSSPPVPPQLAITMQSYGHIRNALFPTSAGDDEAMARAMLAVISSSCSSSSIHPPMQRQKRRRGGTFEPFVPCGTESKQQAVQEQEMIKRGFSMLRRIKDQMTAEEETPEARPTSNQLQHMILERKRRAKLNESFAALRTLLPPGTKKDKASVLGSTIDYVNNLRTQISTLKEKNTVTGARLLLLGETDHEVEGDAWGDGKRVTRSVQILRSPEPSTSTGRQQTELRVTVRGVECDMIDLVLHMLECLKETRGTELLSLDAGTVSTPHMMNPVWRAIFTIQIKGDDYWDEGSFKEAVTGAVDEALAAAP